MAVRAPIPTTAATAPSRLPSVPGRVWLVVLALLALFLATRLRYIDAFPYFLDEGTYADFAYQASQSYHQLFVSLTIGREPLQIWLGLPFIELGANPLTAMRLVSMVAGLATVVVVGLLGRRVGGDGVGLVAAALCVVLPFFVVHDGIGIMEPLVTLIVAAALLLQIEHARRPSLLLAAALGLVFAAGVLTKENTKPAIVLLPLSLLVFDWSPDGRRRRLATWSFGAVLAVVMAAGGDILMRLSAYYKELERERSEGVYTVREIGDVLRDPFATWGAAWDAYQPAFTGYVTLPLVAVAVLGAVLLVRRSPRLGTLLLLWIVVPALVAMSFATLPYPRHVMYLLPPAIVLMALGLHAAAGWIAARLGGRRGVALAAAIVALILAPALVYDAKVLAHPDTVRYPGGDDEQYVTGTGGGAVWPAVADELRRRARGDRVVVLRPRADTTIVKLLLDSDPRFRFLTSDSPGARTAQFGVVDEIPFADYTGVVFLATGPFDVVGRFQRPRGGDTVELYQRR